ncbi:MAG: class I SAM-dependent methyltransferase [Candidatus Shapirobacteria bacterium]|nr:class I SAM-dependent methyltransferase [Candidatus Shapirobacteria bacterium]MDD3003025.1 class I SAM-dependent methyltransferase [Candidatus Shapirobacteria bacterium]MDD4383398.1 class I SAM-dependent methyltransferase [Candidatus Shapirobacteria bacterium]
MAQYDQIAKPYDELMGDTGDIPHTFLINPLMSSSLPKEKDLTVLDLGCGNGYWTKLLAKKYKKVVGIDNSQNLIKIAKNKRQLSNIEYKLVEIETDFPFANDSFDLIFSNMVIHYIKNLIKLTEELYRIIKPNGLIIFSFAHPIFESTKNQSLKSTKTRTPYKTSTLGGSAELTLQYEPLDLIIKKFLNSGFKLVQQKDAIIPADLAKKYPRYQDYIGLPRAAILIFKKN